jgi:predicted DNA binding CopG/RHH family protein
LEHELDAYEIETLVWMNYDLEKNQKKKKITMMISEWTLWWIKLKAAEMWIPYQTCINMILHKYVTGALGE